MEPDPRRPRASLVNAFSADWLALRAGADRRARDETLLREAAALAGDELVADIGGGAGATFAAVAPLAPRANWRVIDNDPALLARLPRDARIEPVVADLAAAPEVALSPLPHLVTASAFFDLVSADWIESFTDLLAASGAALYTALTYDGREEWSPAPPHETEALTAFHEDMNRDKGFGPALGPDAHRALAAALRERGYTVREARSDWRLRRLDDGALIDALAEGGAVALRGVVQEAKVDEWRRGRQAASDVLVGHMDLLATPVA